MKSDPALIIHKDRLAIGYHLDPDLGDGTKELSLKATTVLVASSPKQAFLPRSHPGGRYKCLIISRFIAR